MSSAPGAAHGIRDPGAVAKPVEARSTNLPDDVDDESRKRRRLGDRLKRSRGDVGLTCRPGLREALPHQGEEHERQRETDQGGRTRDGDGHLAIVAVDPSHGVHGFSTRE